VLAIMLAEQTLLNGAVLTTDVTAADARGAGFVFNVLLIARAPLQLFQAVQGSLLPHLAGLEARATARGPSACGSRCSRSAGFALAVALGLLVIGPWAMNVLFGDATDYGRVGLALVALGMGCHLMAATLNQAALARDHAARAALAWLLGAPRSSPGSSRRWWTTRCCGPRRATWARRRCCARRSPPPTGAPGPDRRASLAIGL
jgi:hypothetical protein